jgi:hypothetical protein
MTICKKTATISETNSEEMQTHEKIHEQAMQL